MNVLEHDIYQLYTGVNGSVYRGVCSVYTGSNPDSRLYNSDCRADIEAQAV